MYMFTSYGHIIRTKNKITDFLMILAWASPFKYQLLNMSNIKRDIKQQDFTKSPFCQTLIIFTHLQ